MIKFFRHIRKKLVGKNRFSKYLIYAIGEIVLVVIGILIALQINNWNELQKTESLRIALLKNLKLDLESDLRRLAVTNRFLEDRKKNATTVFTYLEQVPKEIDSIKTLLALERSGYAHTFNPPMPTYNEMKGSGNLTLLKSQKLKNTLASYETFIYNNKKIEDRYANLMTEYSNRVIRYMDPQFGYLNINDTIASSYKGLKFDLQAMSNDIELKALIKNILNKTIIEQRYKEDLVKLRIQRGIQLIDEQLKNTAE